VSLVVAVFASRPVARALGTGQILAGALVISLGIILSATLTPSPFGPQRHVGLAGNPESYRPTCDLSRIGPAPIGDYLTINDTSLNVLLLVPLGLTIGLLPASRCKTAILVLAVGLPFIVEGTQLVVVPLNRACQSADVSDNLLGLVLGLAAGTSAGWLLGRRAA
jgi:hypothetical protein